MRTCLAVFLILAINLCAAPLIHPQVVGTSGEPAQAPKSDGFFENWFKMTARTQAEQPHWIPAVATAPARLLEVYRYDVFWQRGNNGITSENYNGSKGLELIAQRHVEIFLVAPPPYIAHNNPRVKDGFGDWGFILKYRIVAANEQHGNYILTAYFQTTFPTGQYKNGSTKTIITPMIAYGKGFGQFDVQGTFGATLPTGNEEKIGRTFPWNNAFQYHVSKKLWPEIETNYTRFQDGPNRGKTQVFMTPGIMFGNFLLGGRLGLNFGGGFQIATTRFHVNNHNGIFTVRFPF